METNKDIIVRINEKFPHMSKGHKAIASYILEHYDQAAFLTAARLGKELNISESTVVRFAAALGYEGYAQMQEAIAVWVKGKLNSVNRVRAQYEGSTHSEIVNSVLNSDIDNIKKVMGTLDAAAFEAAVEIIMHARTVYIIGIRSCAPLAEFLAFYLNMIRGNVVLLKTSSMSEVFEQMLRIGKADAIIGISFPRYSMRTLKTMEFANDRNARIITITDSPNSPMNLYSSCNLCAGTEMVSIVDSLVAPLSMINALVVALCLKAPDSVKENLENLEAAWNNYQVYMSDEIDYIDEDAVLVLPQRDTEEEE